MARNWFPHNYNARNDEKILELRAQFGWKGYGLFYAFIEMMCDNGKGCIETDKIGGLSIAFNLPKDELLEFIDFCVKIGLFLQDEGGRVGNSRITKHLDKMEAFSEAGKKGAKKRWSEQTDRGAIAPPKPTHAKANADKSTVDKSTVDNFIPPAREECVKWLLEKKDVTESQAKKIAENFWSFYAQKDWMVGSNKMIRWKVALGRSLNWESNEKMLNESGNRLENSVV